MLPGIKSNIGAIFRPTMDLISVTTSESATPGITIPATIQAGDLGIIYDTSFNTSGGSISTATDPTTKGWTTVTNNYDSFGGADGARLTIYYKVLTAADAGVAIAMNNSSYDRKVLWILRMTNKQISSVIVGPVSTSFTNGSDPAAQTINIANLDTPTFVIGLGATYSPTATFTTNSPALTELVVGTSSWNPRFGYKLYNQGHTTHTLDIGNSGSNALQSTYIRVT